MRNSNAEKKSGNDRLQMSYILKIVIFFKNNEWWIIGTGFLVILLLGWYGFEGIQEEPEAGTYPQLDNFYRALQLFFLESGDQPNITLPLQIARFVAPMLLAWASVKALWPVLKDSIRLVKLNSYKDHLVICGIDRKGMEILNSMASRSSGKIVVIEMDKENKNIENCKQRGIIVLTGNANDQVLLRKARVETARYLFAVTGADNINFSIIGKTFEILRKSKRTNQLQCFSHVFDLRLRSLFGQHEIFTKTYNQFNARIFNIYEESARFVLSKYAPERFLNYDEANNPVHILIVGFGWTGESIAKHALRTAHYGTEKATRITIVEKNANEKKKLFFGNYMDARREGRVFDDMEIEFVEADIESLNSIANLNMSNASLPSIVYVCLGSDTLGIFSAVKLRKLFDSIRSADIGVCRESILEKISDPPIVVCLKEGDPVLFESENFNQMNKNIYGFDMVKFGCSKYFEAESDLDALARTVHSQYIVDCLSFSANDFENDASIQKFVNRIVANKYEELLPELSSSWLTIETDPINDPVAKSLKKMNALLQTPDFQGAFLERHPELKKRILNKRVGGGIGKDLTGSMGINYELPKGYASNDFSSLSVFEKEFVLRSNLGLLKMQLASCPDLTKRQTLKTWDELTEDVKDSNRYQADHVSVKLWIAGFDPGEDITIEELSKRLSSPVLLRKLAEVEHNRWMAEKKIAGWNFFPKRDDIRRRHHLLIPFEQLPDNEKKKDYDSIKNMQKLISTQNWRDYQKLLSKTFE